jgi:phosphoesterase RecJ-like protein
VRPGWLNQQLYEQLPRTTVTLQSSSLARMRTEFEGKVAYSWVSRQMLTDVGALDEECEGIVERLRAIKGVDTAVFLRELADGRWKASLRSKGGLDVNALAGRFGGGGHVRAAGCTLAGPIESAIAAILAAIPELDGKEA